eukprot:1161575-Pelagomonas_calceolata.AAC.6
MLEDTAFHGTLHSMSSINMTPPKPSKKVSDPTYSADVSGHQILCPCMTQCEGGRASTGEGAAPSFQLAAPTQGE